MCEALRRYLDEPADESRMTQVLIARELGVTQPTVHRWKEGKSRVPAEKARRLSELTGIPREQIRPDIFQ